MLPQAYIAVPIRQDKKTDTGRLSRVLLKRERVARIESRETETEIKAALSSSASDFLAEVN